MKLVRYILSAALFALVASVSAASTLSATGATGVDVNGTLYDVEFQVGSCVSVFAGCDDAATDFQFQSEPDALAAAQALLDLINANPAFDADPTLVDGCNMAITCWIATPYMVDLQTNTLSVAYTLNYSTDPLDEAMKGTCAAANCDFSSSGLVVYADWSVAAVPVPASMAFLLAGLGVLGLVRARRGPIPR